MISCQKHEIYFKPIFNGESNLPAITAISQEILNLGYRVPRKSGKKKDPGGKCQRSNIEYQFECQMCPPVNRAAYLGETSRNLFTRAMDHDANYRKGKQTSFMFKHQTPDK
jgi:hypothetical protein